MRKIVVIAALLGLMFGIEALRAGQDSLSSTLTLAAIGFVLLAAFTVAELGARLRLPRVTGFIITGVVLGPSLVNILSAEVVVEMRMFNTLALGLIALGAGLEMDLRSLRSVLRTLLVTISIKVLLGVTVICGLFYLAESTFHFLGLTGHAQILTVGLVMGVLSIGTSPAIALAIMKETRAKGRMMDLALNAAVLKDVVVVACLAAAIAVGRMMLGSGATESASTHLGLLARELGFSLLAGAIVGALLILYLRYVKAEMLLFVAVMILSISEVSRALHLELLLVFITAGFVVRNFSHYEEELASAVSMVSLPVFVVFFTNAGASLNLVSAMAVMPLAIGLFLVRAGVYILASRVGGKAGSESPLLRKYAWLGYLPQAGVTLGLTTLAAERMPEIGPAILTTAMATVALNLLVGPITLRRVLAMAGETNERSSQPAPAMFSASDDPGEASSEVAASPGLETRLLALQNSGEDPRLFTAIRGLLDELDLSVDRVIASKLHPWSRSLSQAIAVTLDSPDLSEARRRLRSWSEQHRAVREDDRATLCTDLFRDLRASMRRAPEQVVLPLSERLAKPCKGDRGLVRTRKRLAHARCLLSGDRHPTRTVPLRLLGRYHLEQRCAALCAGLLDLWYRTESAILVDLAAFAARHSTARETIEAITARLDSLPKRWRIDIDAAWSGGLGAMNEALLDIGSPAFKGRTPRLAVVEPAVRLTMDRLAQEAAAWPIVREAAYGELMLRIGITELDHKLTDSLRTSVLAPAGEALMDIEQVVNAVRDRFTGLVSSLPQSDVVDAAFCSSLNLKLAAACDEVESRNLERAAARLRAAASAHTVAVEARASIEKLPESLILPRRASQLHLATSPKDVRTRRVAVQARAQEILVEQMLPCIDMEIRGLTSTVALTSGRIREAVDIARHALSAAAGDVSPDPILVRGAFERALLHLDEHVSALDSAIASAGRGIHSAMRTAIDELLDMAALGDSTSTDLTGWIQRTLHRVRNLVKPTRVKLREFRQRMSEAWSQIQGSQITQDMRRRVAASGFDASEIQDYLGRLGTPKDVPADYANLFSLTPVHEHRLFVAYEAYLRSIVSAERAWLAGGPGSALVIGAHGSGRTSLLNLCELETSAPRLLRPDPLEWRRDVGLVAALAIDLGTAPNQAAVLAGLAETPTTVMIDDLEQWFYPDISGIERLEEFLELVVASRGSAFWLVTAEESASSVLSESMGLEQAFAQVVRLEPLSGGELREAVERRHSLSGRRLEFSTATLSRLATRLRRVDEQAIYFDLLAHISEGNLSRAYVAYLSSLSMESSGAIHPRIHLTLRIALPFLRAIPAEVVAALVHLCRFGPMSTKELSKLLHAVPSLTSRHLTFLQASGLVEPLPAYPGVMRVPVAVRPIVLQGLRELGVF